MKRIILTFFLLGAHASFGQVLLRDIGVIGLASHDMFTWDRVNEINLENGRLDLSTIFDYEGGKRWKKGGNPKNAENAPVWTITKKLVTFHKEQLKSMSHEEARKLTTSHFHKMIVNSYKRLSGLEFPDFAVNAKVTNTEQAVLRALHDILPGRVKTYRSKLYPIKSFKLTNILMAKFKLNEKELDQPIKYFDGDYDQEYKEIKIPFSKKTINLKEVDGVFIEKFSPYNQADMLEELRTVGQGDLQINEVSFIFHVKELFQKGMCKTDNQWIVTDIECL